MKEIIPSYVSAIIAFLSLFSTVLVATINNRSQMKIRKLEILEQKYDSQFLARQKAFNDFLQAAGRYCECVHAAEHLKALHELEASATSVMLFCSKENRTKIKNFILSVHSNSPIGLTDEQITNYYQKIVDLSFELSKELDEMFTRHSNTISTSRTR